MFSFLLLLQAVLVFGVPVKGSMLALSVGTLLLYVTVTTGIGLLTSTFVRTQIAALFGTAIADHAADHPVLRPDHAGWLAGTWCLLDRPCFRLRISGAEPGIFTKALVLPICCRSFTSRCCCSFRC